VLVFRNFEMLVSAMPLGEPILFSSQDALAKSGVVSCFEGINRLVSSFQPPAVDVMCEGLAVAMRRPACCSVLQCVAACVQVFSVATPQTLGTVTARVTCASHDFELCPSLSFFLSLGALSRSTRLVRY